MIRRVARLAFPLAAFVLVLAVSLGFEHAFSPTFKQCIAQHEHDEAPASDDNHRAGFSSVISANVRCSGEFVNSNASGITALATFIIAAFTGTLWIATTRQARLTKEGVDIANKTLELQFRPRLIVRNIVVTPVSPIPTVQEVFSEGYPVTGQFYVANVGDSPAEIVEVGCWVIWLRDGLPMRRPYETLDGNTAPWIRRLVPGTSTPVPFVSDESFPTDPILAQLIERGQSGWGLYVLGWVEYSDENGIKRRTTFCRQRDAVRKRFFPMKDDPDYENAE